MRSACLRERQGAIDVRSEAKHRYLQDERCKTKQNPVVVKFDEARRCKNRKVTKLTVKETRK